MGEKNGTRVFKVTRKQIEFWLTIALLLAGGAGAWAVNSHRLSAIEVREEKRNGKVEKMGERLHDMDVRQAVMETQVKAIHEAVAKPK